MRLSAQRSKKNEIKPWLKEQWYIPNEADHEFVCCMEDVLDIYTQPYDPQRPLICMDETPANCGWICELLCLPNREEMDVKSKYGWKNEMLKLLRCSGGSPPPMIG